MLLSDLSCLAALLRCLYSLSFSSDLLIFTSMVESLFLSFSSFSLSLFLSFSLSLFLSFSLSLFLSFSLSLFLPFFLSSFLPFFLSSFLPFFLSSFLPFFLPSFLPSFLRHGSLRTARHVQAQRESRVTTQHARSCLLFQGVRSVCPLLLPSSFLSQVARDLYVTT